MGKLYRFRASEIFKAAFQLEAAALLEDGVPASLIAETRAYDVDDAGDEEGGAFWSAVLRVLLHPEEYTGEWTVFPASRIVTRLPRPDAGGDENVPF